MMVKEYKKGYLLVSLITGFFILFFLHSPTQAHASLYTVDPIGLSIIIVENPYNCTLRYYQWNPDEILVHTFFVPGISNPPYKQVVLRRLPLASLRGEKVNLGYEPIIQAGRDCPDPGLITLKDVDATFEKLPFTGFPPGLGLGIFYKPDYLYDKVTFPRGVILHIYTLPFGIQPPYVEQDLFYPVIFIHGLGGNPDDWVTGNKSIYWDRFLSKGYPEDFLATYAYAYADGDPDTYDYQGDVTKIDDDLPALVDEMAVKFENQYGDPPAGGCNDACVDLIGFSLGGIVSRQYLNEHPLSNKIRKVVTIASPHQGVFWLKALEWSENLPFGGNFVKNALIEIVNAGAFIRAVGHDKDRVLDLRSEAAVQMRPQSFFMETFNSLFYSNPIFHTDFGDIDMQLSQRLFHFELKTPKISVGDGIVSTESAKSIPAQQLTNQSFSDEASIYRGKILPVRKNNTYEYQIDLLTVGDLKYFHLDLPRQTEVVEDVIDKLRDSI